jgi:hypothetical protein
MKDCAGPATASCAAKYNDFEAPSAPASQAQIMTCENSRSERSNVMKWFSNFPESIRPAKIAARRLLHGQSRTKQITVKAEKISEIVAKPLNH